MNYLEDKLNRELLRYAVSRQMFCPVCQDILDTDDAVLMTTKDGKTGTTAILCGNCHDKMLDKASALDHATLCARYDTIDGRTAT